MAVALAAAVWASPEKDSLFTSTMNTVMKETRTSPPPAGAPGPFSLSDESLLRNYFVNTGFKDVTIERMNVTFDFESSEAYSSLCMKPPALFKKCYQMKVLREDKRY